MDYGTGTKSIHILLLEDDRAHQDLILRAFRDDPEQFRLSVTGNIRDARQILEQDPPDLIIADWILPDGKGLDILPRTDGWVTIPLIIMTSFGDEHLAVEIMKSGAIDYVVKSSTVFKDLPHIAWRALRDWENIRERKRAEETVQESQKRLADIIGFLPDAVLAIDNDGRVIAWNNAIERMTGVTAADMLGKGDHEYSIPFYGERRQILIDLVLIDDPEIEKKYDFIQRDDVRLTTEVFIPTLFGGKGAYLWGTAAPLYDSAGKRIGAIEVIRDITDRKQAEHTLQVSEKKYRFLIDNVRDIVWQTTPDLTFTYVSAAAESLTGYLPDDLMGTSLFGILTEPSTRVVQQRLRERMEDYSHGSRDLATVFEAEIRKKDGGLLWIEISSNAVFAQDGTIAGFQGISRDIAERKRAERALIESEVRFRDLFSSMSSGVIIYEATPDGRDFIIRDINHAVETIEQVKKDEIVGKGVLEVFPGVVEFGLFDVLLRVARTGIAESHPVSMYHDNRIEGWRENYVYKLPSGEVIALYEDVTERKKVEEELQAKEYQLSTIYRNTSEVLFFLSVEQNDRYRFLSVNQSFLDTTGIPEEQVIGKYVHDVIPEPSLTLVLEKYNQAIRDNTTVSWEEITEYPSGKKWGDVRVTPLTDATGRCTNLVGSVHDITERKLVEVKLRESEERYRSVIENAAEGITVAQDGMLQYANSQLLDMIQAGPDEITNRLFTEFIHPDDRALVFDRFQRRVAGENVTQHYDFRVVGTKGKITWVQLSAVRIVWNGRPATLNFLMDITDRKEAEAKLRESEHRSAMLLKAIPDMMFVITREGVYRDFSVPDPGVLVLPVERIIGTNIRDSGFKKESADAILWHIGEAIRTKKLQQFEYDLLIAGSRHLYEARIIALSEEEVLGIVRDITDRKQAEENLRESRQILEGILNTIPVRVFWKDKELTYLGCNTAFAQDAGFGNPDEVIGKDDYAMVWQEQAELYRADDRAVIESGNAKLMIEEPQTTPAGDTKYLLTSKMPLCDTRGDVIGILGTYLDISDRKKAEEMLRESEERLLMAQEIGHIGGWEYNLHTNKIWGSAEGARIYGLPPVSGDFPIDQIEACIPERERVNQALVDLIQGGKEYNLEFAINPADGSPQKVIMSMACVEKDAQGNPVKVVGVIQDITTRKRAEEALRESEIRFREIFNKANDGIELIEVGENGFPETFIDVNETACRMGQYTREELLRIRPVDIDTGMYSRPFENIIREIQTLGHATFETGHRRKDGTIYPIEINTHLITLGGREVLLSIIRDITERKRADEVLRTAETRFRALIQNSSDIIRVLDVQGRIVYESSSAERILGYPSGFMTGRDPQEYVHPDDLARVKNDFLEVRDRTNPGTPTEFRILKADGNYLWVDSIGTNLLDVPGVNGIVMTTRPIQQRKEAEQALLENQARLATAMDIAGLVNWEFDVATGMFTFDDRFYALYETTADREGGHLMSAEAYTQEFVYPDDRPVVLSRIKKMLEPSDTAYSGQMEHRITPRDGSVRTIIARYVPVLGPDGKVIRVLGANQDITDFKLMESEIRSLNTVLEQRVKDRTEALAKTNEALEEEVLQRQETEKKLQGSYDEKVLLLKEIHHRVKNNLQIIASLLNLQSRYIKDESTLAAIRESQNRVKAMALVHEKLYRSEDISHISLYDYIRFLGTGLFQFYDAKARGIQFTLEIHEVNVDIDAAIPLGLILNELISNSLKYAFPEGKKGEIAISVKKEDHTITVLFRDNGIGIPADLDWRDTQSLGLRLVNTLVDQMNGTVELDRSSGTQFTMVLHEKEQRGPS
ncbi:MAG: PAS domain S-box protein [Methanoregula sp.]|jgi:PAS domain S-box-containing protein